MIVDHDEQSARRLERVLAAEHSVTISTSARTAAMMIADGYVFDLILCDLHTADISAMDLYEVISQHAPGLTARVVFMTGEHSTPAQKAFLAEVPNVRLQRPVATSAIRELMRQALTTP